MSASPENDYVTALYKDRLVWFQDVQTRGQILLTIDGIFASFLTATILGNATSVVTHFWWDSWAFLLILGVSLGTSLFLTVRSIQPRKKAQMITRLVQDAETALSPYPADVMWWFMTVSRLDQARFLEQAGSPSADLLARALAYEGYDLSKHLAFKYQKIRQAFLFTTIALGAFLAVGASYLYHVAR